MVLNIFKNRLVIILVVLLIILGIASVGVYGYLVVDPKANSLCESCHSIKPYVQDIAGTPHGELNCHSCHHLTPNVINELIVYVLYNPNSTEIKQKWSGKIGQFSECINCHNFDEMLGISIHREHYNEEEFLSKPCTVCHNPHQPNMTQQLCFNCHKSGYED